MSLGQLGSLNVLLSADTASFSSAMDKAAYTAEKTFKRMSLAGKLSLTALAAAVVANAKNALTFSDTIGDMSERLGMSTSQMSKLAYAAKMSDMEIESLEAVIRKMYVSAFKGSEAFQALGVQVKDSSGRLRNGYEILLDVAEAFKEMPDGAGKASAAMEIFGKSGADIVPLLNQGKVGIQELGDEAKKLGVVIEEESARNADRFDKFMKKMEERIKGFGVSMVDSIYNVISGLKTIYMSSEDYQKSIDDYRESVDRQTESSQKSAEAAAQQAMAYEMAAEAAEKHKKLMEEGEKLTESLRTAQEKYDDEMQKYHDLLEEGAISNETYTRAAKKSLDQLVEAREKTSKVKDAAKDMGFSFQSAFEDAIIDGKKFDEVLVSLLQDIERIILRTAITGPLAEAISSGISGLFSSGDNAKGVSVSAVSASRHGNIFNSGKILPFGTGGIITSPTIFPMANGGVGLAGEAGYESIMPLVRTGNGDLGVKSVGGGTVEINVYAPEGTNVKQDSQQNGDTRQINIIIDDAVASAIGDSGSKTYRSLKKNFGLSQTLTRR